MIYVLVEKVIRYAQMHVDCLRATGYSKIYIENMDIANPALKLSFSSKCQ